MAGAALAAAVNPEPSHVLAAAVAAMLPDIDHQGSRISRLITPFRPVLGVAMLAVGAHLKTPSLVWAGALLVALALVPHRGITHSLPALAALALFFPGPAALGYASHLLLDFVSGGIPLFWPLNRRIGFRLAPTGGVLDRGLGAAFLVAAVFFVGGAAG